MTLCQRPMATRLALLVGEWNPLKTEAPVFLFFLCHSRGSRGRAQPLTGRTFTRVSFFYRSFFFLLLYSSSTWNRYLEAAYLRKPEQTPLFSPFFFAAHTQKRNGHMFQHSGFTGFRSDSMEFSRIFPSFTWFYRVLDEIRSDLRPNELEN